MPLDRARHLHKEVLSCSMSVNASGTISGICGSFVVEFRGSPKNPVNEVVLLSTGPEANATH